MAGRNMLNVALDYIDDHIEWKTSEIKEGLSKITGFSSSFFTKCFDAILDESLILYIKKRKIFFICKKIKEKPAYPLSRLAQDFGYEEQTQMNRDFRTLVDFTPKQVLKNNKSMPDNRINVTVDRIEDSFELEEMNMTKENLRKELIDIPNEFFDIHEEFGFSLDTCHTIAELAFNLGVPFHSFANKCFDAMIELKGDNDYVRPEIEKCIEFDISSEKELEAICNFFDCKYYEIDRRMVWFYRKNNGREDIDDNE